MKKLIILSGLMISIFALNACGKRTKLNLLNWGEYISPDLIEKFEAEYYCTVQMEEVTSSEIMYQKIKSGTTAYDIAIPGDYVIEQMANENMIKNLDYSRIDNYDSDMFHEKLSAIIDNSYANEDYNAKNYGVPYFWGAYAMIYTTDKSYVGDVVKNNGFNALFDRSLYGGNDVNISMYSVPRFGTTAYLASKGIDINSNIKDDFNGCSDALKNANYKIWGDDNIKKGIAAGNLDLGLVQLGDFFDQYYVTSESGRDINFDVYVPENNAAFFDAMVIPEDCQNESLAYEFINFMLDEENAYENACYVGYCPTLKSVAEETLNDPEMEEMVESYPVYLDPFYKSDDIFNVKLFRYIDKMSDGSSYSVFLNEIYLTAQNT